MHESAGRVRAEFEARWESAESREARGTLVHACLRALRRGFLAQPSDPERADAYAQTLLELATGPGEPGDGALREGARELERVARLPYFARLAAGERLALLEGAAVAWRRAGNAPRAHSAAVRWAKAARRVNDALESARAYAMALELALEQGRAKRVRRHAGLAVRVLRASSPLDEEGLYALAQCASTAARTARTAGRAHRMALQLDAAAQKLAASGDPRARSLTLQAREAVATTALASRAKSALSSAKSLVDLARVPLDGVAREPAQRAMAAHRYAAALELLCGALVREKRTREAREVADERVVWLERAGADDEALVEARAAAAWLRERERA